VKQYCVLTEDDGLKCEINYQEIIDAVSIF